MMEGFKPSPGELLEAVATRDIGLARYLLDQGADPNEKDLMGDTCLLFAIREKSMAMVKLLLEKGADINMKGRYGATPLMFAVRDDWRILNFLIETGARLDLRDDDNETAMDWAFYGQRIKARQLLTEAPRVQAEIKAARERKLNSHTDSGISQDLIRSKRAPVTVKMRPQP